MFTDNSDEYIAQLTEEGLALASDSPFSGVSFKYEGWALGYGGFNATNPIKILPIDITKQELISKAYPEVGLIPFTKKSFQTVSNRSVVVSCRIYRDTVQACKAFGELGIWVRILNSPKTEDIGKLVLFSVTHMPIQSITRNTQRVFRIIHNY